MKKNKSELYRKPHIGVFVSAICEQYKLDSKEVAAFLVHNFPELKNREKCANCDASMREYPCVLTYSTAELLSEMAQIVRIRLQETNIFTEANQVHRREINSGYTIASQFTIASKLGLIAKIMTQNEQGKNVHDTLKGWCITSCGFDFLSGKPVPEKVMVFRRKIQECFGEMITMEQIYKGDNKKYEKVFKLSAELMDKYHKPKLL